MDKQIDMEEYSNVLDIRGIPKNRHDLSPGFFSDHGAWHGFALPPKNSKYAGGFIGPLTMDSHGEWAGPCLAQFKISDDGTKESLFKDNIKEYTADYLPGRLVQHIRTENFDVFLKLTFISDRTAMIQATVTNVSEQIQTIIPQWYGHFFNSFGEAQTLNKKIVLRTDDSNKRIIVQFSANETKSQTINIRDTTYTIGFSEQKLAAGQTYTDNITLSFCFNDKESDEAVKISRKALLGSEKYLDKNTGRWSKYLEDALNKDQLKDDSAMMYHRLAVKCIQTLMTNLRSSSGDLFHNGLFPSSMYHGFYGFWAWDSWKHSVALSHFDSELAKDQIKAMFAYQNDQGMIADCIYRDKTENNWRNTKPPLAGWAVWKVYEQTQDTTFVKNLFSKLLQYHRWWYQYRDHDQNGLCEYGSTDGTLIAAKWESGMDNAVRFDETQLVRNDSSNWSMNQESVDLNAYLYKEKIYLAQMAKLLNKDTLATKLENASKVLKKQIQTTFYDPKTGYFYDRMLSNHKMIRIKGPEGWIPLWAGVAKEKQAQSVINHMKDSMLFASYVPFPTLNVGHNKFNPTKGYWRGSVWLDQAWFAVRALENYDHHKDADKFRKQLLQRPEGLFNDDKPIRENYHPVSGKGLNAKHFSWSAVHLYLLYRGLNE